MTSLDESEIFDSLATFHRLEDENSEPWTEETWIKNIMQDQTIVAALQGLHRSMEDFEHKASKAELAEILKTKSEFDTLLRNAQNLHDDSLVSADSAASSYRQAWTKLKASYNRFASTSFQYSKHLDALFLAAPSYVQAAWGAVHLLLMVQINDQKMKESITDMLWRASEKCELLETFTAYYPTKKMVAGLAAIYAAYIQLLQYAVRYYAEHRIKRVAASFLNRWESHCQPHVNRLDGATEHVLRIGLVSMSRTAQHTSQQVTSMRAELRDFVRLVHLAMTDDQHKNQVPIALKQRLSERSDTISRAPTPRPSDCEDDVGPLQAIALHRASRSDARDTQHSFLEDLEALQGALFPGLTRLEQLSQARRSLHRPRAYLAQSAQDDASDDQVDTIIRWLSSSEPTLLWIDRDGLIHHGWWALAVLEPLVADFVAHHERCLVLKYFCKGLGVPKRYNTAHVILQSFLFSALQQYQEMFLESQQHLERKDFERAAESPEATWQLLVHCLETIRPQHLLIVVDAIDHLSLCASNEEVDASGGAFLTKCFNKLMEMSPCIVRILVTADSRPQPSSPAPDMNHQALITYQPHSVPPQAVDSHRSLPTTELVLSISTGKSVAVSFSELWALYPSGSVAYAEMHDQIRAFVIEHVQEQQQSTPSSATKLNSLILHCWATGYHNGQLVRLPRTFDIAYYTGSVPIDTLLLIPSTHFPADGDVRVKLTQRGRRFCDYSKSFHCLELNKARTQSRTTSRVIVDFDLFSASSDSDFLVEDFPRLTNPAHRKKQGLSLRPTVFLTCPAYVPVYDVEANMWMTAAIDDLDLIPHYGKGILNNINLDNNDKEVIFDVAEMHARGFSPFKGVDDPFEDHPTTRQKEGRICLFHGASGSGKSYAVKAVADVLCRPIVKLLGSTINENKQPGATLRRLFGYAARWRAFILLESIDHYLSPQGQRDDVEYVIPSLIRQELMATPALVFIIVGEGTKIDVSFRSLVSLAIEFKPWLAERRYDLLESLFQAAGVSKDSSEWSEMTEWIREDVASYDNLDGRQLKNLVGVVTTVSKANDQSLRRRELRIVAKGMARLNKP